MHQLESGQTTDTGYGEGRSPTTRQRSNLHALRPPWGLGPPTPRRPRPEGGFCNVIVNQTGRPRPAVVAQLATLSPSGEEPVMPDLWDTNPENVPDTPGEQPAPATSDHDPKEVRLKDHRGRLRSPAYILIALVIALGSILLLIAGVMLAPG